MFEHLAIFFFSAYEMFVAVFMVENRELALWLFEAVGLFGLLVVAGYMSPRLLLFITVLLVASFAAVVMMLGGFDNAAFYSVDWPDLWFNTSHVAAALFPIVFFSVFLFAHDRVRRGAVGEASPLGAIILSLLLLLYLLLMPMTFVFCFGLVLNGTLYDTASKFVSWTSGALLFAGAVFVLAPSVIGYLTYSLPAYFVSEKVGRTSLLVLCAAPWLLFDFKGYSGSLFVALQYIGRLLAGG